MARRPNEHLSAICLPIDPDALIDDLAPNTGGDDSSYTETGPRPGRTVPDDELSRLRPVLSGDQVADLDLVTLTGGHAVLDTYGAVQVGYRFRDEANTLIRGWSPPNWVQGWSAPAWTTTATYQAIACTIPSSQKVAVSYRDTAGGSRYVTVYDPATATWGTAVAVRTSGSTGDVMVAVGSRLIATAGSRSFRSDDDGATWQNHSLGVWPSTHDPDDYDRARATAGADGTILGMVAVTSTSMIVQLASSDGLSTWTVVHEEAGGGLYVTCCALPTGGFLVAYVRDNGVSDEVVVKRLSNAYEPFDSADEVVVLADGAVDLALTCDPDGLVWLHYSEYPSDGTVKVMASVDGGASFEVLSEGAVLSLSTADAPISDYSSASCEGSVILVGNPDATTSTTTNGSVVAIHLGGWSNLPSSNPSWTDARDWTSRSGHGPSSGNNVTWFPGELPGSNGWTASGTASQVFLSDGRLRILTSGGDSRSYLRDVASQNPATTIAGLVCPQGGDLANNEIILYRRVSWTGHEFAMSVRFSETDGLRVRDATGGGSTLANLSTWDCSEPFQVLMLVSTTSVDSGVWVRRFYETAWTEVWTGALTDNTATPSGTGRITFGNVDNSAGVMSVWYFVADSPNGVIGNGLNTTPAVGRPLTSLPVPLPAETGRAWLAAVSGPGALGETYSVDVAYDYPIANVIPTLSPSPAVQWRSTSTAEHIIAWDHGRRMMQGDSLALVAMNCNFRNAALEYYDGAAWVTAGTMDLAEGFGGVGASLTGDVLTPSGVSAAGRYLAEGEAAGGHVTFVTSGNARRIKWNTAGSWGGSGPQARIILEGCDDTEDTTAGVHIAMPSGVMVVHSASLQVRRRWRIRIPASQATPDGDYRAGVLVPMACRILGRAPDWGWSREAEPNSVTTTSRSGTTRTQRRGPLLRTWSMGWESGVDLFDVRGQTGEWIGPDDNNEGIAWQDVPWLLEGLLELSGSGEVLAVALAALPADGETLTDRSLFLYGRFSSSVRQDHIVGTEGQTEIVRGGQFVVKGVV